MLDFGFYNMDCMEGMAQFPDKFFELAIVDPPYGINIGASVGGQSHSVKVGGANRSRPKSTGGLMTHKPPMKSISQSCFGSVSTKSYGEEIISYSTYKILHVWLYGIRIIPVILPTANWRGRHLKLQLENLHTAGMACFKKI